MQIRNLLTDLPADAREEQSQTLAGNRHAKLLRIVSPPGFKSRPFLQPEDEWVVVLQGEGILEMEGRQIRLGPGDSLLIPAGIAHRVTDTSTDPLCIWLALHLDRHSPPPGAEH